MQARRPQYPDAHAGIIEVPRLRALFHELEAGDALAHPRAVEGSVFKNEADRAEGERAVVFENVIVRSGKGHDMEVHIDTDEANAIAMRGTPMMEVLP